MGESSDNSVCRLEGGITATTVKFANEVCVVWRWEATQEGGAYLWLSGLLEGMSWGRFGPLGGAPAWCGQSCCPAVAPGTL